MLDKSNIVSAGSVPAAPHSARQNAGRTRLILGGFLLGFGLEAACAEALVSPDKSHYTLFHPTPRELMRELTTDRPDKTESAYSLDAGHFQVEMDLVTYGRDRYNTDRRDVGVEAWSVGPVNLKLGLLNNLDAQLVIEAYNWIRVEDRSRQPISTDRRSGFGDMTLRAKINLLGNDGGKTALGLLPYVKLPTNQNGLGNSSVEGGLIVPLEYELSQRVGAALNTGFQMARDESGPGHHAEFINSLTFGYGLFGQLSAYTEFWSLVSAESNSDWLASFDLGFNYLLTADLKLDFGVNVGLTRATDDWNPFVGLSWRY
ncbi:MAG: transporter [Verrucomicrobiota bacterium]